MVRKRVSVPDFDEIALSKETPSRSKEETVESSKNYVLEEILKEHSSPATVVIKSESVKTKKPDTEQPAQERRSLPELITSLFNPISSNQNIDEEKASSENIPLVEHHIVTEENNPVNPLSIMEEIPKIEGGYASFVLTQEEPQNIEPVDISTEIFEDSEEQSVKTQLLEEPLLEKPLNPEEAITLVKKLNIWNAEPSLEVEIIEPFLDYYYITRSSAAMKKMGNSFVVDKTTGLIFQVNASMPENLNVKKVLNREIEPIR